jgi:hypothetical protein
VPTRSTRSPAWLLWILTLLSLAATIWLDHLLRLAAGPSSPHRWKAAAPTW